MIARYSARRTFSRRPKRSMKVTINMITIHARYRIQRAETKRVLIMLIHWMLVILNKNHHLKGVNK